MKDINSAKTFFESVVEKDEKIEWVGRPNFTIFLLTGVPFLIFGLLWGAFDYAFVSKILTQDGPVNEVIVPFILLHLAPCYLSILNMVRLMLVYQNTFYAITNRRMLIRGGFFGIDFKSVDYDKIQNLEVNINPIEKMYNVGTIRAQTAATVQKPLYHKFIGVDSPYDVFKKMKETSTRAKESQLLV